MVAVLEGEAPPTMRVLPVMPLVGAIKPGYEAEHRLNPELDDYNQAAMRYLERKATGEIGSFRLPHLGELAIKCYNEVSSPGLSYRVRTIFSPEVEGLDNIRRHTFNTFEVTENDFGLEPGIYADKHLDLSDIETDLSDHSHPLTEPEYSRLIVTIGRAQLLYEEIYPTDS